jgi:hypothetical protein
MKKVGYDTTLARMAGNIAAGLSNSVYLNDNAEDAVVACAVRRARKIVAEIRRTKLAGDCTCGALIGELHTDTCPAADEVNRLKIDVRMLSDSLRNIMVAVTDDDNWEGTVSEAIDTLNMRFATINSELDRLRAQGNG